MEDAARAVIDPAALAMIRRIGGDELLRKLVDSFLGNAPERLRDARDALARGDAAAVQFAMHALGSSAGQLGAVRARQLCWEVERLGRAGTLEAVGPLLDALDLALSRARERLIAETGPPDGGPAPAA